MVVGLWKKRDVVIFDWGLGRLEAWNSWSNGGEVGVNVESLNLLENNIEI